MTNPLQIRKVIGGVVLTLLWLCCFFFIKPTLIIDYGANITTNFKLTVAFIGLLILIFYHIFYRSNAETTKLSLTVVLTMIWLALIFFYPYKDPNNFNGGAIGFFTLVGGLAISVFWVRFFSDEIF